MADIKSMLEEYFTLYHYQNMPDGQRKRFDDMYEHGELSTKMQYWYAHYEKKPLPDFRSLSLDEWGSLYDSFQSVLQQMYAGRHHEYKTKRAVQTFLKQWFEGDYGEDSAKESVTNRIFCSSEANTQAQAGFDALRTLLQQHPDVLKLLIANGQLGNLKEQDLIAGLQTKKFNRDEGFRYQLKQIVGYVAYYSQYGDANHWPQTPGGGGLPCPSDIIKLDHNFDDWFDVPDRTNRIKAFKQVYEDMLQKLVNDATVRKAFTEKDTNKLISGSLENALKETDYDDAKGDNFIEPKTADERNLGQRIKKFKADTYENYLRKFTNPSRGTRLFFTEQAQNIVKAIDKVGIKPTDGLDGILTNKDKILKEIGKSASKTKDCFDWFVTAMTEIQTEMPNAFAGALKNASQLRLVVSRFITKSIERNKVSYAKAGLEILSVIKYGMMSSKTMNAVNEGLKDVKLFSDDKLSWNKNEGIKTVTKAIDATAKLGVRAIGAAGTGIYNFIQHRRTKIGNDVRNNKILNPAYQAWKDKAQPTAAALDAARKKLDADIARLNAQSIQIHGKPITIKNIDQYVSDLRKNPVPPSSFEQQVITHVMAFNNATISHSPYKTDNFHDLIAYWDMLESVTRTHAFTLGSMAVKRRSFRQHDAKQVESDFNTQFGNIATR